jgi:hypothetical protein
LIMISFSMWSRRRLIKTNSVISTMTPDQGSVRGIM